jgi:hypothetical protein
MKMPRTVCLMAAPLVLILSQASFLLASEETPKRFDFDRYSGMLNRSPFAVATAVTPVTPPPNFAKDLYIANAARLPEGDLVTIQSATDRNFKEYISSNKPNDHGYSISNLEWSDVPGRTKATISKDGQSGQVTFNQALIAQAPPAPAAPGPPSMAPPAQAAPMPAYVPPKQPSVPGVVTPPPAHVRGVIQRNPNANLPPRPNQNQSDDQ